MARSCGLDRGLDHDIAAGRIVDRNAVAIAQVHCLEPFGQSALFLRRQRSTRRIQVERVVAPRYDGLVDAIQAPVAGHVAATRQGHDGRCCDSCMISAHC